MIAGGVFAVDRGVFDHPAFAREPYTEREAWLWMVGAAAWKPMRVRAGRAIVDLDRGQLAFATRFLARKWKWSEARVRRFLKRIKTDAMVTLQSTRETTQITICNYDKYAFGRRTADASGDAPIDAQPTHSRRKEEELKEVNKEKKEPSLRSALEFEIEVVNEPPEAKLFRVGKTILVSFGVTERRTGALIGQWLKVKPDPAGLLAAIQYSRDQNVADPIAYVSALVHSKGKSNGHNRETLSDRAGRLADAARELEREAGLGRSAVVVGGD